jgi:hypothetical protein
MGGFRLARAAETLDDQAKQKHLTHDVVISIHYSLKEFRKLRLRRAAPLANTSHAIHVCHGSSGDKDPLHGSATLTKYRFIIHCA